VTALGFTQSARGIANKNLLLGVAPGQLYSIDLRQVHPRRPLAEPSQPEKEEVRVRIIFIIYATRSVCLYNLKQMCAYILM
jgi:hypothetical protein